MLEPAAFRDFILAIHILAVVVAFGVTFAYPIFGIVGMRMDPRAMPWFHRMQHTISRRLISPGMVVILAAGIYLASDEHAWKAFYVQWGIAVIVVIGAVSGAFLAPREKRLAELAERDVAAAPSQAITFSDEYNGLVRRVGLVGIALDLLIVLTIFFMALHT